MYKTKNFVPTLKDKILLNYISFYKQILLVWFSCVLILFQYVIDFLKLCSFVLKRVNTYKLQTGTWDPKHTRVSQLTCEYGWPVNRFRAVVFPAHNSVWSAVEFTCTTHQVSHACWNIDVMVDINFGPKIIRSAVWSFWKHIGYLCVAVGFQNRFVLIAYAVLCMLRATVISEQRKYDNDDEDEDDDENDDDGGDDEDDDDGDDEHGGMCSTCRRSSRNGFLIRRTCEKIYGRFRVHYNIIKY